MGHYFVRYKREFVITVIVITMENLGPKMGHYFVRYKREFVITEFDCT